MEGQEATLSRIHEASEGILERVGVRFHHPKILEMLHGHGVRIEGGVARFSPGQVMEWVRKAPARFTLFARNPAHDMHFGEGLVHYAAGYGCPTIVEASGARREALLSDYIAFAKLVQACDRFKVNGGILVQPADVLPHAAIPTMIYAAMTLSDKCVMAVPGEACDCQKTMDMAEILAGGRESLRARPIVLTMISTLSPLQVDRVALESILVSAEYGQPLMISPGPMAGATGPVTLAGNIAMGNAEALATIAICQMCREGLPVIYGLQCTTSDPRTAGISIGSPGYALQSHYAALLARFYNLPCRTGGTSNDAKEVSVQSGYESVLPLFVNVDDRVDLIVHAAGILEGYAAMSYEKFMVDLEIIEMIEYFRRGVTVTEETLSLDVIAKVGPGGEFLTHPQTCERCRTDPFLPRVSVRGGLGGESFTEKLHGNIRRGLERLLAAYRAPEMDESPRLLLDEYMRDIGVPTDRVRP